MTDGVSPSRRGSATARLALHVLIAGIAFSGAAVGSPSDVGGPTVSKDWKWKMTFEYKDDADRSWVLPKLAFSRPLTENFEGEVALSYMHVDRQDNQDTGVGDVEFKGKWALLQGDGRMRPGIALEPKLIVPAGPRNLGLGVDTTQFELPFLIAWQGRRAGLYTKAGYRQALNDDRALRRYMGGVLATYQPTPALRWGLDLYAEAPRHETGDYKLHTNLGVNWYLSRAFEIQALVGRSLRHPDDRDAYKVKFVVEYKFDGAG